MPYVQTTWVDGTTLGNQTRMNNLESQYGEAMQSFNQDLLAPFVESGLLASRHNSYASTVLADSPLRYYRLDEASGTIVFDISGNAQYGTTHNSPTQNVVGALTGDPDTAYTFASASNQYVSLPTTGLPTGNGAMSAEVWFKFAANPAATAALLAYGVSPGVSHQDFNFYLDTSGRLNVDVQGTGGVQSAALTTGVWHHGVFTWDGTTLRLYVDGASVGTPTTPGAQSIPTSSLVCNIAALVNNANTFNGQLDEVAIYSGALSAARVTAHYNAGTTATTQVDLASGVIVATQSDSTTRRRAISSTSFNTVTINTTYYLYAQPDGTTYWSTTNTPAANSLAIAQVTTDGSGNVKLVTDMRTLVAKLLPNASGGVSFPAIGGQVTAGSFGAPVIIGQVIHQHVTATTDVTTLICAAPATGLYRISGYIIWQNNTNSQVKAVAKWTDPDSGASTGAFFATPTGGSASPYLLTGSNTAYTPSLDHIPLFPLTFYALAGAAISFEFQDPSGSPNDYWTIIVERMA